MVISRRCLTTLDPSTLRKYGKGHFPYVRGLNRENVDVGYARVDVEVGVEKLRRCRGRCWREILDIKKLWVNIEEVWAV